MQVKSKQTAFLQEITLLILENCFKLSILNKSVCGPFYAFKFFILLVFSPINSANPNHEGTGEKKGT